jgi:hypothetical protein
MCRFDLTGGFRATNSRTRKAAQGRELQFAYQDSSRSNGSNVVVRREGQQYLESRHPVRETAGTWMTAMSQTP